MDANTLLIDTLKINIEYYSLSLILLLLRDICDEKGLGEIAGELDRLFDKAAVAERG